MEELEEVQTNMEINEEKLKKFSNDLRKVTEELTAERNRLQQLMALNNNLEREKRELRQRLDEYENDVQERSRGSVIGLEAKVRSLEEQLDQTVR